VARPEKVCLGIVVGVHGVRGAVRIKSFTADPAGIAAYGEVSDEAETRRFRVKLLGAARGAVIATLSGVGDRNSAEGLRNLRLYVPRAALPPTGDNEYYHADLIGLAVERTDGTPLGRVAAVHNFGAGDILAVRGDGGEEALLPFQQQFFPTIDIAGGRLVADLPDELVQDGARPRSAAARKPR
jgi:16S rRNA processing protein RimM